MTGVVKELIKSLNDRQKILRLELVEIRSAKRLLKESLNTDRNDTQPRITFRDMVSCILSDRRDALTAVEIQDEIKMRYGINIKRTSVSPQLTRLKKEGVILMRPVHEGKHEWYLSE